MKIYIAGKITGLKKIDAYTNFCIAEHEIKESGYCPLNPMKLCLAYPRLSYEEYMAIDRALIDISDGVLFLDNWVDSSGAKREMEYAVTKGKHIYTEQEIYQQESNESESLKRAGGE